MTSTPTRPVDYVVITTKGLQDKNIHILDGATMENKGKIILREKSYGGIGNRTRDLKYLHFFALI